MKSVLYLDQPRAWRLPLTTVFTMIAIVRQNVTR